MQKIDLVNPKFGKPISTQRENYESLYVVTRKFVPLRRIIRGEWKHAED